MGVFSILEAKAKIGKKTKLLGKMTFHVKLLFHLCRVMVFQKKQKKSTFFLCLNCNFLQHDQTIQKLKKRKWKNVFNHQKESQSYRQVCHTKALTLSLWNFFCLVVVAPERRRGHGALRADLHPDWRRLQRGRGQRTARQHWPLMFSGGWIPKKKQRNNQ